MTAPSELPGPEREEPARPLSSEDRRGAARLQRAAQPRTCAECLAQLIAVLEGLDDLPGLSPATEETLSLAAAHVQQAIELIQTIEEGHA